MFEKEGDASPVVLIIVEDCVIEPSDENIVGKEYSFTITMKRQALPSVFYLLMLIKHLF